MPVNNQYNWVLKKKAPKMIVEAVKLIGTKEIKGKKHNPEILAWAKTLNIEDKYEADETPWCGLAHAIVTVRAGKHMPLTGWNILRALKFQEFGKPVPNTEAMFGDTLIFKRPSGGHVGLYIGEDEKAYHVLGGNQSDAYGFCRIEKNRLVAVRRPDYNIGIPKEVKKVWLKAEGGLSEDER
jgi:uncharacterized protein (TIGR02594 family)